MGFVLTKAGSVSCAHSGTVATQSTAKLTVGGLPVLVLAGIAGKPIAGCTTPVSNTPTSPCTTVLTATGTAAKLTAGSQAVALASLTGTTNGVPATPGVLSAQAGQSKLTAV